MYIYVHVCAYLSNGCFMGGEGVREREQLLHVTCVVSHLSIHAPISKSVSLVCMYTHMCVCVHCVYQHIKEPSKAFILPTVARFALVQPLQLAVVMR